MNATLPRGDRRLVEQRLPSVVGLRPADLSTAVAARETVSCEYGLLDVEATQETHHVADVFVVLRVGDDLAGRAARLQALERDADLVERLPARDAVRLVDPQRSDDELARHLALAAHRPVDDPAALLGDLLDPLERDPAIEREPELLLERDCRAPA
jgi:hypothetical protein